LTPKKKEIHFYENPILVQWHKISNQKTFTTSGSTSLTDRRIYILQREIQKEIQREVQREVQREIQRE
jgi:hypothetical protein